MKVLSIESVTSDRRARITGGVYIDFESVGNVNIDDYFNVELDGSTYNFQARGIKVEGDKLRVSAREVGYWCEKTDQKKIDLRKLVGREVIPVTDEKEKADISLRSCWC